MAATATLRQRPASGKFTNISVFQRSGVLVLRGYGITVKLNRGHLHVDDGMCGERWEECLARVGHGLHRLVVIGNDGIISLAALRWLADQDVSLTMLDRAGRVLTTVGPAYPSDARLRRAQALAHHSGAALKIAQHLISAKLAGQERVVRERLGNPEAAAIIGSFRIATDEAASMETVLLCEREGANVYWGAWRGFRLINTRRRAVGTWKTRSVSRGGAAAVFSTAIAPMLRRKCRVREIAEAAVRPDFVAILPHVRRLQSRLKQIPEEIRVAVLVPKLAVEALGPAVLHGLAWMSRPGRMPANAGHP